MRPWQTKVAVVGKTTFVWACVVKSNGAWLQGRDATVASTYHASALTLRKLWVVAA